jgi:hypothetical protein
MAAFRRTHKRARRGVTPAQISVARGSGLFRRDDSRDAYVLRVIGRRVGPALVRHETVPE